MPTKKALYQITARNKKEESIWEEYKNTEPRLSKLKTINDMLFYDIAKIVELTKKGEWKRDKNATN